MVFTKRRVGRTARLFGSAEARGMIDLRGIVKVYETAAGPFLALIFTMQASRGAVDIAVAIINQRTMDFDFKPLCQGLKAKIVESPAGRVEFIHQVVVERRQAACHAPTLRVPEQTGEGNQVIPPVGIAGEVAIAHSPQGTINRMLQTPQKVLFDTHDRPD